MGLRGPNAQPLSAASRGSTPTDQPWEKPGLKRWQRVIAFLETLPVTSGLLAGKTMKLMPFQKKFVKAVYQERKGKRLVRQAVLSCPRKNGKTGLIAGLALCHLLGPEAEPRGQIISCGNDRSQAALVYEEMSAIIRSVPWMENRIVFREYQKAMKDDRGKSATHTVFKSVSSETTTKHGLSPSLILMDELGQAKSRELFDIMASSQGARKQPLLIVISTQAASDHHVLSQLIDYGLRVQSGEIKDSSFHLTFFSAPKDADVWDKKTWLACNPAAGKFLSMDDLTMAAQKAQELPAQEPAFRNLRLNQRVDSEPSFISPAMWEKCCEEVNPKDLEGESCYGGLDLSSTTDLTSLVLFFPDSGAILPYFWLPSDGLKEKEITDRVPYTLWRKKGFLECNEGRAIDRHAIALRVAEIASKFKVEAIGFDRWRFEDLQKIMADEGINLNFLPVGQGFKDFSPGLDELERLLLSKRFKHGGHPILRWCASNCVAVTDPAGNRKLDKKKSRGRIDGMVALSMACKLFAQFREQHPLSKNDFSGGLFI